MHFVLHPTSCRPNFPARYGFREILLKDIPPPLRSLQTLLLFAKSLCLHHDNRVPAGFIWFIGLFSLKPPSYKLIIRDEHFHYYQGGICY